MHINKRISGNFIEKLINIKQINFRFSNCSIKIRKEITLGKSKKVNYLYFKASQNNTMFIQKKCFSGMNRFFIFNKRQSNKQ